MILLYASIYPFGSSKLMTSQIMSHKIFNTNI